MKPLHISGLISIMLSALHGCSGVVPSMSNSDIEDVQLLSAIGTVPDRVTLEQGWNDKTRMDFWYTSQGSRIIPYNWFAWLEQADSTDLFRSSEHMEKLRYLPMSASKQNAAGLPIGFALDQDKKSGDAWVGLTCAACHTNQLDYQGTRMLIEGAPTLANFMLFYRKLVDALDATNKDDARFERFARNVLAQNYNEARARSLRKRLLSVSVAAAERLMVNDLPDDYAADFTSYARLDAFGNIQNAGTAFALHDLNNKNAPTAPVSYPFLWGTHQSDVVQWNASAPNTPVVGPLVRNIGEVVGVFGGLNIEEASYWKRRLGIKINYSSSVDMLALGHLEKWVRDLRSPVWPQQYLPGIDVVKAAQGAALYKDQCADCHKVIARADEGEKYISIKTPVTEVGTDPAMAWNADYHMAKSLILEGEKDKILAGSRFKATTPAISVPVNGVVGIVLKDPVTALKAGLIPYQQGVKTTVNGGQSLQQHLEEHIKARLEIQRGKSSSASATKSDVHNLSGLVYKARPLNGIWATAPYLHNGSVANLWQLLQRPEQRLTEFWVGSREFDPVNVGFSSQKGLSKFRVLDSAGRVQRGNSNAGHNYGTGLSDAQKWELVEYMKTL